jgi:hypothetical protein
MNTSWNCNLKASRACEVIKSPQVAAWAGRAGPAGHCQWQSLRSAREAGPQGRRRRGELALHASSHSKLEAQFHHSIQSLQCPAPRCISNRALVLASGLPRAGPAPARGLAAAAGAARGSGGSTAQCVLQPSRPRPSAQWALKYNLFGPVPAGGGGRGLRPSPKRTC